MQVQNFCRTQRAAKEQELVQKITNSLPFNFIPYKLWICFLKRCLRSNNHCYPATKVTHLWYCADDKSKMPASFYQKSLCNNRRNLSTTAWIRWKIQFSLFAVSIMMTCCGTISKVSSFAVRKSQSFSRSLVIVFGYKKRNNFFFFTFWI